MRKHSSLYFVISLIAVLLAPALICLFVPDGQILSLVRGEIELSGLAASSGVVPANLYGYVLSGGLALALLVLLALSRDKQAALRFAAAAVWLGLLASRGLFCLVNLKIFELCPRAVIDLSTGGLSLYGALLGVLLAARLFRRQEAALYRPLVIALAVFIPAARLAEFFSPEALGVGIDVDFSGILTIPSMFGDVLNVRLIEIIFGVLLLLAVILFMKRPTRRPMDGLCFYLFLFGVTQILMESLRQDGHMVWGFVKAQQILSLLTAALCLMYFTAQKGKVVPALALSAVAGALCFAMEKQLDRGYVAVPDWANYCVYTLILAAYLLLGLRMIKGVRKNG